MVHRSCRIAAIQSTLMSNDVLTRFACRRPPPRTHRGAGGDAGRTRGPGRRRRPTSMKSTRFCEPGARISTRAGVRAGLGPADRDDGRYGPHLPGCRDIRIRHGGPSLTVEGRAHRDRASNRPGSLTPAPDRAGRARRIDSRHPDPATEIRVHPLECEACFAGPAIGFQVSSPTGRCDICGSMIERRFRAGAGLPLAGMIVRSSVTSVARLDGRPGRGRRDDASCASVSKDPRPNSVASRVTLHETAQHCERGRPFQQKSPRRPRFARPRRSAAPTGHGGDRRKADPKSSCYRANVTSKSDH